MTGGGFHADSDRLERHGAEFARHADRAGEIVAGLRRTLQRLDGCWGADEVGSSFAEGHLPHAQAVLEHLGTLPDRLASVGGRFADTAAAYRAAESDNLGALRAAEPGADR
ncbi:hypothetical protein [Gandjariella thermophila]|uniref:ESX-1 secretion-associated protein n=1 Tax=Gandjariella thermophila TaxID=1931992 RepID=A0A4D4J775_9PSEU|nr:hypothetical protein [Gandjariella thermophila]GDY31354.1 hypothetical protein GTS_29870 [Gandjariella thermophila]